METRKQRLQFDFSEEAVKRLVELQTKLDASSRAEVVRHALGILEWACNEIRNGSRIIVEKKDGVRKEVVLPFLSSGPIEKEV